MANEDQQLFEVPTTETPSDVPELESGIPQALPDLAGLGLQDYDKQIADSAEASSPDQANQEEISDGQGQTQETPEAKDDPARMQYWQSKADKAEAAFNKLNDLAPNALKYAPIIEAIQTDPEVLDFISKKANSGTLGQPVQNGQPMQNGAPQQTGPPTKPARPSQYDPAAAIHETDSDSYKYREALEQYRDDVDSWRDNQESVRYQQMQIAQQQQIQSNRVMDNYNTLKHEYGANDADIQTYNAWLNNPETMNIHNLWRYHQYLNQPDTQKKIHQAQAEDRIGQAKRAQAIPNTPAKVAGKANPTLSDADAFNLDLLMTNKNKVR